MPSMQMECLYRTATGGLVAANILNFVSVGGTFDEATVDNIAGYWKDFVEATLDTEIVFVGATRFLNDSFDPSAELFANNTDSVNGSAGDLAPVSSCYRVYLSAGVGRRRRGRIFLPGVDEAKVNDGGVLQGTTANDILTNLGTFVSDSAVEDGWLLGVASRLDGVVRGVSSIGVSGYVGTQRRRMYALSST